MSEKYTYKFVKLQYKGICDSNTPKDYHEIISEHAKEGWRFIQLVNAPTIYCNSATYYELIFEKENR